MPTEGFFQRWSRLKAEPGAARLDDATGAHGVVEAPSRRTTEAGMPAPGPVSPAAEAAPAPTLADVARLTADSDYSAFVGRDVDKAVRRSAMKKLFADPHFNIGDGLDIYMGDYNKPDPIPAAMMAALRHADSFFAQAYPEDDKAADGGGQQQPDTTGAPDATKETSA